MGKSSRAVPARVRGAGGLLLITATAGILAVAVYGGIQALAGPFDSAYLMAMLTVTAMSLLTWFVFLLIGTGLLNGRREAVVWLGVVCVAATIPIAAALIGDQTRPMVLARPDFWAVLAAWCVSYGVLVAAATQWDALSA